MKVALTKRGRETALNFIGNVWDAAIERRPQVADEMVDAIEHIIAAHLKLGRPTEWVANDGGYVERVLRLDEDDDFVLVDNGLNFYSLVACIEDFHRITGGAWRDWEDAEALLQAFGPDYHDDNIPWRRAEILINWAISSNGTSLKQPLDGAFKWAPPEREVSAQR